VRTHRKVDVSTPRTERDCVASTASMCGRLLPLTTILVARPSCHESGLPWPNFGAEAPVNTHFEHLKSPTFSIHFQLLEINVFVKPFYELKYVYFC
jgi:hypothetical protein